MVALDLVECRVTSEGPPFGPQQRMGMTSKKRQTNAVRKIRTMSCIDFIPGQETGINPVLCMQCEAGRDAIFPPRSYWQVDACTPQIQPSSTLSQL